MQHVNLTIEVLPAAKAAYEILDTNFCFNVAIKQELKDCIKKQLETNNGELDLNEAVKTLNNLELEIAKSVNMPNISTEYRLKGGFLWFKSANGDKWYADHDVLMAQPISKLC